MEELLSRNCAYKFKKRRYKNRKRKNKTPTDQSKTSSLPRAPSHFWSGLGLERLMFNFDMRSFSRSSEHCFFFINSFLFKHCSWASSWRRNCVIKSWFWLSRCDFCCFQEVSLIRRLVTSLVSLAIVLTSTDTCLVMCWVSSFGSRWNSLSYSLSLFLPLSRYM